MLAILIIFNILFISFFRYIWVWYLSILPIFFILFIIWTTWEDINPAKEDKENIKQFIQRNISIFAWLLIILWVQLLGTNLAIEFSPETISISIIFINIFFWIFSYLIKFTDWLSIFHYWYYFSIWILTYRMMMTGQSNLIPTMLTLFIPFTLGIYSFITYIISNFSELVEDDIKSLNFLFFNLSVIILIHKKLADSIYFWNFLSQIYLALLFLSILFINKLAKNKVAEIINKPQKTLDEILNWTKTEKKQDKIWLQIIYQIKNFFNTKSFITSFALSFLNIWLIFFQIYLFFKNIWTDQNIISYEIIYWLSILIFFWNYLLLKQINLYYNLQRIFAFFILNLGIYLSIINIFWKIPEYMAIWWITWNLINSLIIFATSSLKNKKIIFREDLYLWVSANTLATIINTFFIFKLDYSLSIRFWFIVLYVWIQLFIKFYNLKYINNFSR